MDNRPAGIVTSSALLVKSQKDKRHTSLVTIPRQPLLLPDNQL
jgi:hypothetical protein